MEALRKLREIFTGHLFRVEKMIAPPVDGHHRQIDYLRISITDRCNLRCIYCMPSQGVSRLSHAEILSYEEILRLARIAVEMGITKIRITGGEPLVRRNVIHLCESLSVMRGVSSLSITTNGVLLDRYASALRRAGIKRVNISLDTLKPSRFSSITKVDCFSEVWRGIEAAEKAGFSPIKLNVVVMRGVNDDEVEEMALLTRHNPFHVRFIEFMPFPSSASQKQFVSSHEMIERISRLGELLPFESQNSNGPARYFRLKGALGKIGIISPFSQHFCPTCNRMRLTADGKLRTCLFSRGETDLRALLRRKASDEELVQVIGQAILSKPERHTLDWEVLHKCISRPMVNIGG